MHEVDVEVDSGDIVMQKPILSPNKDYNKNYHNIKPEILKQWVQKLEADCIIEFIELYRSETLMSNVFTNEVSSKQNIITYKDAGVDISAGNQFVEIIKNIKILNDGNDSNEKSSEIGGFGGIYNVNGLKLCATTDGVGTKLEIAKMLNKYDTIGIDLVAMCVNDLIVQERHLCSF